MIKVPSKIKEANKMKIPDWFAPIEQDVPGAANVVAVLFGNLENVKLTSAKGWRKPLRTSAGLSSSYHKGWDLAPINRDLLRRIPLEGSTFRVGPYTFNLKPFSKGYGIYADTEKMRIAHLEMETERSFSSITRNVKVGSTGKSTGVHLHIEALHE